MATKTVFLTSGTSYVIPADWAGPGGGGGAASTGVGGNTGGQGIIVLTYTVPDTLLTISSGVVLGSGITIS